MYIFSMYFFLFYAHLASNQIQITDHSSYLASLNRKFRYKRDWSDHSHRFIVSTQPLWSERLRFCALSISYLLLISAKLK